MALSLNTQLNQSQRLTMTQALRQQIEMLQLSTVELIETINEELETNPILDVEERVEVDTGENDADHLSAELERELSHDDLDTQKSSIDMPDDDYSEYSGDEDRKRQFIENAVAHSLTLTEHLIEQAHLLLLTDEQTSLVERVITSLDENGFFIADRVQFAEETGSSPEQLEEAIRIVQTLEPVGCAAHDLRESLLIQARSKYQDDSILISIIQDHFDLLSSLMYEKIARSLDVSIEVVTDKSRLLQSLSPYPGRAFSHNEIRYIVPDIEVRYVDGEILITFNDEWVPRLKISPRYLAMLSKKDIDKKLKEYIKEKIGSAKQLMKNIAGRNETIEKVVRAIMNHQVSFLEKGPGHLKPLTYAQVAEVAECHESTVSRVSSNKFMQCSWGTYELRYFFVSKIRSSSDERSSDEVLSLIRDVVAKEKPESPYSDDEIAEFLASAGVAVARRTIAKYRDILHIPSSSKRKRLNLFKKEGGTP